MFRTRTRVSKAFLACGLLYAALYAIANDVVAAAIYNGYSRVNQAISELSAKGAPSKAFLNATTPLFVLLLAAFGVGIWRSARKSALRVTGALLVVQAAMMPLWLLAPMTGRTDMVEGTLPANDLGHFILTGVTVVLFLLQMGFGAASFGKRFRLYSVATALAALIFGILTSVQTSGIASGGTTPWMGLFERVNVGAWLLWLSVLAIATMRLDASEERVS
jgi:hypothetical protein